MKRDALREAARALRESADDPLSDARPGETRARVMASLRGRRARRAAFVKVALPIAAVLAGSMAWAAATGRLPSSLGALFPGHSDEGDGRAVEARAMQAGAASLATPKPAQPPAAEAPPAATEAPPAAAEAPPAAAEAPLAAEVAAPQAAAPPWPAAEPALSPARGAAVSGTAISSGNTAPPAAAAPPPRPPAASLKSPPPTAPPPPAAAARDDSEPPPPVGPDEHGLYTSAHRAHFVERNPGSALAAWDAYLRAAPQGRFAVEAHYNRALCLVRLGRAREAQAALDPFANGAYGGYRQAEARALLHAMEP